MSLNIALSILFSRWFITIGWMPHGGLALANSLATFLESFVLLFFMHRRLSGLEGGRVLNGLWKALAAGGAMTAAIWGWVQVTSKSGSWLVTLGGIAAGALVYGVALILLRTPEISKAIGFLKRKFTPAQKPS
jgi:putative peptidoglycan lipid II flippase